MRNSPSTGEIRKKVIVRSLPRSRGKKTLILDLDETLIHSLFQPTTQRDFVIPVTQ